MKLRRIALRNLGRHTRRTVLSVGAISLASAVGVFFLALLDGMQEDARDNVLTYQTGVIQLRHRDFNRYTYLSPLHLYLPDTAALEERIQHIPGVTGVHPRISAPGQLSVDHDPLGTEPGERHNATAFALRIDAEAQLLRPDDIVERGRLPRGGSREVALGYRLAEKAGLGIGDSFTFVTETAAGSVNALSLEVAGILNFPQAEQNARRFIASFDTMQSFLAMDDGTQQLAVMTADPENSEEQLAAVRRVVAESGRADTLRVTYWKEQSEIYVILESSAAVYDIMVIFFLVLGATVIVNTTMMTVLERYREIGVLGAMGMRPREIVRLFFLESLTAGVISAVIGVTVGSVISLIFGSVGLRLPATYSDLGFEISNVMYPTLTLTTVLLMVVYTVSIPALVSLLPARKAARVEPVDAINAS